MLDLPRLDHGCSTVCLIDRNFTLPARVFLGDGSCLTIQRGIQGGDLYMFDTEAGESVTQVVERRTDDTSLNGHLLSNFDALLGGRLDVPLPDISEPTIPDMSLEDDWVLVVRVPSNQSVVDRDDLIRQVLSKATEFSQRIGSDLSVTRVKRRPNALQMFLKRKALAFLSTVREYLIGYRLSVS